MCSAGPIIQHWRRYTVLVIMVHQIKNSLQKKYPNTDVHNGLEPLHTIGQIIHIFKVTTAPIVCFLVLLFHTEGTKEVLRKEIK